MLPYFPIPFPDELLYSIIARYHRHTCSPGPKATLEDLFRNRSVKASVDLQGHLGALAGRLPPGIGLNAETLARKHTLLPYYTAYQRPEVARAALEAVTRGTTEGLHLRLGIATWVVRAPVTLRFCPACDAETLAARGERCWRRAHQLPGVLVCPDHGGALRDSTVVPRATGQHDFVAATEEVCGPAEPPSWAANPACMELLGRIARGSAQLLSAPHPGRDIAGTEAAVHAAIAVRGLARPTGRPHRQRLEALRDAVLAPLRGVLAQASEDGWLLRLTRRHRRAAPPLDHVLLDVLLAAAEPPKPRSPAPARRRFLADEPAFVARLTAFVAEGKGLCATARALGVDPGTVRQHVTRLGLAAPWKPLHSRRATSDDQKQKTNRASWQSMLSDEPRLSVTELRRRLPAEYAWLYRNDRDWLRDHRPEPATRGAPVTRVDWHSVDNSVAADVAAAVERLKTTVPPTRVTVAALERAIGRPGWIGPRKGKLPRTMATVRELVESVEAFRTRRVAWVEAVLGPEIAPWRMRQLAGLPSRWRAVPADDA
ncbi:TnsD family Tn7-like transposition protein [Salinarimonas rosea]|uniref:TnsD family Tn7-like transposition protein n=1 Tax=Salinarimonas rosea TaxID=552063 RepID=UPI000410FC37|nr:TnsD family Tn7-like transposition protein [Salinarimonas rosea]